MSRCVSGGCLIQNNLPEPSRMISGSASGWDVGMYGGWWQISLQAELSDGLEMLAESTAHRLSSILVLSCAGTYGTAAVGCAISGAHGCKWGSGREKGVGYVCVCVQWDICTLVGPCKVGWADAGMLSDLLTLLVFPNRNDSAVPCSSWLQSRPCTAASPGVAFVGICRVISGKISRLQ